MLSVQVYVVLVKAKGVFENKFNDQMITFKNFFFDFLTPEPKAGDVTWRTQLVYADSFFTRDNLLTVAPGSVILLASHALHDPDWVPTSAENLQDRLLSSHRLWLLLNATHPLIVINTDGGSCSLDWPNTTHHMLYRTTWCTSWHRQWMRSKRAEQSQHAMQWPWVRSFPYGTAYNNGSLTQLRKVRRAAQDRRILVAFRGHSGYRKPSRTALKVALKTQRQRMERIAESVLRSASYAFGRVVIDVVDYQTAYSTANVSYLNLLRESVFTLSPPGDLWETFRTYEAIEAGSIPIVLNWDDGLYKRCERPGEHFIQETEGALAVRHWAEIPDLLEREAANVSSIMNRQQHMLNWLANFKIETRRLLISTSTAMANGTWLRRTGCIMKPLSPRQVQSQHRQLAAYWRRPQNYVDSELEPGLFGDGSTRQFSGRNGFCGTASEYFGETCKLPGCSPPLIDVLKCNG